MLDFEPQIADTRAHYERQDNSRITHSLMSFEGEFNFSDHSLVPEIIQTYVLYATKYERFRQVPLDTVNEMARAIGQGKPGSPLRFLDAIQTLKQQRRDAILAEANNDKVAYTPENSIDDWSSAEFKPEREEL